MPKRANPESPALRCSVWDIPQAEQYQGPLNDQLRLLVIAGNRLGLYDAVDCVRRNIIDAGKR